MKNKIKAGRARSGHLRNDIVGAAFTITFALLVVFVAVTYVWQRSRFESDAIDKVQAVASVQEARVEAFVDLGISNLDLTRSRNELRSELSRFNETGDLSAAEEIHSIIAQATAATSGVESISIYDIRLQLAASTASGENSYDAPAGFLESAGSATSVGSVVQAHGGQFLHLVGGPITLDSGQIGVAVIAQSIQPLFDLAADYTGLGETGETILATGVDGRALFIAPLRFDDAPPLSLMGPESDRLPMNDALAGVEGAFSDTVDYRGEPVVAATRRLDATGWGLVVKIDRSEALAPTTGFTQLALAALVLGSLVAGLLAWGVARVISAPIQVITKTAQEIASGDRAQRVPVDRDDDIGELATAFNQMTREINALTLDLEYRVAERTAEIEAKNAELNKKNTDLTRLMDERETFLAGVSHEVRSPLTAMIGFLDLINETGDSLDPESRAEMLETVAHQADDILNLIEDLLAAARADAGTLTAAAVRVDLGAQSRQVIEGIAPGSRSSVEYGGTKAVALADPARVRQIVRNLLTNAGRYGGPRVKVNTFLTSEAAGVEVRDNGEGIPDSELDRIFQAYGQGAASKSVSDSVGLGLHVASQLAELMGGELVYRRENGWSVFTLALPVYVDIETSEEMVAAATTS